MPLPNIPSHPLSLTVQNFVQVLREHVRTLDTASLWIEGEISNWSTPASGHAYFSLKDGGAQLRCVMFRGSLQRSPYVPRHGDAVLVQGTIDIYEARGEVQLIVHAIAPAGAGVLQAQYEALRQRLLAEGLFAPERKRSIPPMPAVIGVVTSATGAALQDILAITARRWPLARIYLTACQVQGSGAAQSIVHAIQRQTEATVRADVLIIGRGGGSLEDLWAFNEEIVVRAVAQCPIPTVSAVGHETDVTLCDFAADVRAATPSAAAELVTPDALEIMATVGHHMGRAHQAMHNALIDLGHSLELATQSLAHPRHRIENSQQALDALTLRWQRALDRTVQRRQSQLEIAATRLTSLSPLQVLARGYCLAQDAQGRSIARAAKVPETQPFTLRFSDGITQVQRAAQDQP